MRGVILSRHRLISTSLLIQQRYTGLLFADFATRVRGSGFGFGLQRLEGAGRAIVPRPSHWCRHWTSASARGVGWKYGPRPSLAAIYAFKAKPPKGLTWLRSAMRFLVAR